MKPLAHRGPRLTGPKIKPWQQRLAVQALAKNLQEEGRSAPCDTRTEVCMSTNIGRPFLLQGPGSLVRVLSSGTDGCGQVSCTHSVTRARKDV